MSGDRLKIGISACFMHADPNRALFTGKTLQYVEQSIAHWVMSTGSLAVMIPSPSGATQRGDVTLDHYAQWLDGLVLHGGADVSPLSYGEQPLQEKWAGDKIRDEYEMDLVAAFERAGKPVFGVCRGLQEMNVALGGSLYQRLHDEGGLLDHREPDNEPEDVQFGERHEIILEPDSAFAEWAGGTHVQVNSLHGQGIKELGRGMVAEGRAPDGLVEAVRIRDARAFAYGVQWHPEWRHETNRFYDRTLKAFARACALHRRQKEAAA